MVGILVESIYHVKKILRLKSVSKHISLFESILSRTEEAKPTTWVHLHSWA